MSYSVHKIELQNHAVSWSFSRSYCNGKEKDYESGFHYYGARYYWSEVLTSWLSVDPMSDKYPSMSPYNYCAWNPVMLTDPDGNEPWYKLISGYDKNNIPKAPTANRMHPKTGEVRPHHGMDMASKKGARINSAASGKILFSGVKNGYGNTVVVDHGSGYYTLYAHMNTISVKAGDEVQNGSQLGEVGNTGIGTGPHLHVEYIKTDNIVNIFGGNKNASRFNPMDVNDLQNIIDGKEFQNVKFLDGHSEMIGNLDNIRARESYYNSRPEPKTSERLQESRIPVVKTVGDILKIIGL